MVKKAINEYTLLQIINNMLDPDVDALIPIIGNGQWVDGLGWVKVPAINFPRAKFEWSGSNCIYAGFHTSFEAGDNTENWIITKREWSGSNCIQSQTRIARWSDRSTMEWDF